MEVLDIFITTFFVKNYYFNLSFFQVLQSDFLKTKKNSLKEDASHLKSFDVARVRRGTLKQGKGKRKVRKSQTTINIFLF